MNTIDLSYGGFGNGPNGLLAATKSALANASCNADRLDLSYNPNLNALDGLFEVLNTFAITKVSVRGSRMLLDSIGDIVESFPNMFMLDLSDIELTNDKFEKIINCMFVHYFHSKRTFQILADWNSLQVNLLWDRLIELHDQYIDDCIDIVSMQHQNLYRSRFNFPCKFNPRVSREVVDAFLRFHCGSTWSSLVSQSAPPIEVLANRVIAAIPHWMLDEALESCGGLFPKLELKKFGSSVNGFGGNLSDVDLVLVPENEADWEWYLSKYGWADSQKRLGQDFLYYLSKLFPESWETECVLHARIPLLRIRKFPISRKSSVDVDITFMNNVCLLNSQLLRAYAEQSPDTFALCQIVKLWTKSHQLVSGSQNSHSFPSSYAWICMVLFFLQERISIVPRLAELIIGSEEPVWGCKEVFQKIKINKPKMKFPAYSAIMLHFFQFLRFLLEDQVSMDFVSEHVSRKEHELHVVDPLERGRVLTRNVTHTSFSNVQKRAKMTLNQLENISSFKQFTEVLLPTKFAPSLIDM